MSLGRILTLPSPMNSRWQPLRAGLVDLFFYDYEEFWFRDGHLLLRGNNGTGKSKVLALTLPFLLDGQLSPARVEPDGDPNKRMEWNLLLGGRYSERVGYTWLEFGRLGEDGELEIFTIGCGIKAVQGRGTPRSWFFTSERRIGQDLWLVGGNGLTLSRERLIESLGGEGMVFDSAARYRRAVDERLFQLGEERYGALVNLLIQLRQPQLSKRPNEKALSVALTEALPPLDQAVLSDVADAFRNLESERDELDALKEAGGALDEFRDHYRCYAQIAARRRARQLRQAQSRFDKTSGELNAARSALETARIEQETLESRSEGLEEQLEEARTRERVLRDSPEMRSAEALRQAEAMADEKTAMAADAREQRQRAEGELARREQHLERRASAAEQSALEVSQRTQKLESLADEVGLRGSHRALLAPLQLPDGGDVEETRDGSEPRIKTAEGQHRILYERRREALSHVEDLNRRRREAEDALRGARRRWQELLAEGERLDEERVAAEEAVVEAGAWLVDAFSRHCREARELRISEPEEITAELEDWVSSLMGDNPGQLALARALQTASAELAEARARWEAERRLCQASHDELVAERQRLEAGGHARPPSPYTRDEVARRDRPGAPLWQLVDFREDVSSAVRSAIEAALEGAGLLDAWVMPEGTVLSAESWDVVLVPGASAPTNLMEVLLPAVDRADAAAGAVADEVLRRILATIAWGESGHPTWIDAHGRWRLGPAQGAWTKGEAEYIGRGAREAARRRRLAELARLLEEARAELAAIDQALGLLTERHKVLDEEWRSAPADTELRRAHDHLARLLEERRALQPRIDRAGEEVSEARQVEQERRGARDEAALDLDLPTAAEELAAVAEALSEYRAEGGGFWPTLRRHWDNRAALHGARIEVSTSRERLGEQRLRVEALERAAREAGVHRDSLRATVGAAVAELERRLADNTQRINALKGEQAQSQKRRLELERRVGTLHARVTAHEQELQRQEGERREAVRVVQEFAAEGLLSAALPELEAPERAEPWPVEQALRLARRTEQALQGVDDADEAWRRHQRGLYEHITTLQNALSRHGHEASAEQITDLVIVRVVFQSRQCTPDELALSLKAEMQERQELLDARERELLENHLISEVASHLQGMISEAERMVTRMNHELAHRPTSTGMKLRLVWKPLEEGQEGEGAMFAPVGLAEARKRLLRQVSDAWSAEDREAVGQFLHRRIGDVRAADEGGTLLEHLERALDYRRWHRFVVERWQDGQWRRAYGPASGGERALAVTIPLFAAASSHYTSAGAHAPRLVLLDEAFAGVDDDSRAKCMGLLAQFDLDFVMTSEREWGCYAELPGLAIAQLVRREGIDAVYVSRWTWDGRRRERASDELPSMQEPERAAALGTPEPSGSLF